MRLAHELPKNLFVARRFQRGAVLHHRGVTRSEGSAGHLVAVSPDLPACVPGTVNVYGSRHTRNVTGFSARRTWLSRLALHHGRLPSRLHFSETCDEKIAGRENMFA